MSRDNKLRDGPDGPEYGHIFGVHGSKKDLCIFCDIGDTEPGGSDRAVCQEHTNLERRVAAHRKTQVDLATQVKERLTYEEWSALVYAVRVGEVW